jgi:energy-coupling factor transporter transmembrane protein EcfT
MTSDQNTAFGRASVIFACIIAAISLFIFIGIFHPFGLIIVIVSSLVIGWFGGLFYLIYSYQLEKIKWKKNNDAIKTTGHVRRVIPK